MPSAVFISKRTESLRHAGPRSGSDGANVKSNPWFSILHSRRRGHARAATRHLISPRTVPAVFLDGGLPAPRRNRRQHWLREAQSVRLE
jgi:hypothetical protein